MPAGVRFAGHVVRIPMSHMKTLLLLAAITVVFAGCSRSDGEPGNGGGSAPTADTTPPSTPTGLTAAVAGSTGANLSWSASTDNVGVTGYIVRRNGVQVATPATTSYADTGLAVGTYSYTVAAGDAAGNISPDSASASVTIADTTPPSTPTGLTAAVAGSTGANLSWSASTDNVGVTGYIVRRNGTQVATPATTSYADTGLAVGTYSYTVAAAAAAPTAANLSWSASTDNVGVTGYIVRRNGTQVAAPATTSYADTGLAAATIYSYSVAARDAAGNISPDSTSVSITTAPVVQQVTGAFAHQGAVTIAGLGFGSKAQAAPLVWDDASGTNVLAKWSGFWPDGALTPSSNMQYMTAPILAVNPPHNRVGRYLTGAHESSGNFHTGQDVAVWKDFNKVEGGYLYLSYYSFVNPAWVSTGVITPQDGTLTP